MWQSSPATTSVTALVKYTPAPCRRRFRRFATRCFLPRRRARAGARPQAWSWRREEEQVDRLFDRRATGNVDERAVVNEAGVERDERVALDRRRACRASARRAAPSDSTASARDSTPHAARERAQLRQSRRKRAVDEDELARRGIAKENGLIDGVQIGGQVRLARAETRFVRSAGCW